MKINFLKKILLSIIILFSILVGINIAMAATDSKSVDITFTIPSAGGGNNGGGGGGGGGGGDNLPVISNVAVTPAQTTAAISFTATDDIGISATNFVYSKDLNYGSSAAVAGTGPNYTVSLSGLESNTTYNYKIKVTDTKPQTVEVAGQFITTQVANVLDVTPPAISNIDVIRGVNSATISWDTDEPATGEVDYGATADYTLQKQENNLAQTFSIVLNNLDAFTVYHFQIVATDAGGNASNTNDAEFTTLAAQPAAQCDLNNVDCNSSLCAGLPVCRGGQAPAEICNNNIDDNNNGATDCADAACAGFSGCANVNNQPAGGVGGGAGVGGGGAVSVQLDVSKINFFVGNGIIPIIPKSQTITSLAGTPIIIVVQEKDLKSTANLVLAVSGTNYPFAYNAENKNYSANIMFPSIGDNSARLNIDYGAGQTEYVAMNLRGLPFGDILGENDKRLEAVVVTLKDSTGQVISLEAYGQINPFTTNANGNYGWVVPNGLYQVAFSKDGYFDHDLTSFRVENNVINESVSLIKRPKSLAEVIDTTKSLGENAIALTKNLGDQARVVAERTWQAIGDLKRSEAAQTVAGAGVAPVSVGAAAVSLLSFLTFSNLLPFLRLLFLQPLMLLGLRRRQKWGQVYNALNKMPVDLATIRLIDADTNKVVQTRVTDKNGRYAFVANPGRYKLEVTKNRLAFPTSLLFNFKEDGRRTDLYHGEVITVTEKDAVITASIPLDPIGEIKTPVRLIWYQTGRILQSLLSSVGWLVTLASLYISPRWYVWALAGAHTILFVAFRRMALPPKIKSWGIVNDELTKKPVDKTVARLFNAQFNKLVSTQITDRRGRYYFMAGDDKYFVTYDHSQYAPQKTDIIDLKGKEADTIAKDVELKKSSGVAPSSAVRAVLPNPPAATAAPAITPPTAPQVKPPANSNNKPNENILG